MPKLTEASLKLVRDFVEDERARGSQRLAAALEMLLDGHDRQTEVTATLVVEPVASRAVLDIIAERLRQTHAKGYTAAHDDHHATGEIIRAGWGALQRLASATQMISALPPQMACAAGVAVPYRELLVQSAALTVAEIERVDRAVGMARVAAEEAAR